MPFRQCTLTKPTATGTLTRVSWIPAPFCTVGEVVKLRERGEAWDDGWTVIEAGSMREDAPEFRHLMYTCHELR